MSRIIETKKVINWGAMGKGESITIEKNRAYEGNQWAQRQGLDRKFHGHLIRPGMEDYVEGERKFKIIRTK